MSRTYRNTVYSTEPKQPKLPFARVHLREPIRCPTCYGDGVAGMDGMGMAAPCMDCDGAGWLHEEED